MELKTKFRIAYILSLALSLAQFFILLVSMYGVFLWAIGIMSGFAIYYLCEKADHYKQQVKRKKEDSELEKLVRAFDLFDSIKAIMEHKHITNLKALKTILDKRIKELEEQ